MVKEDDELLENPYYSAAKREGELIIAGYRGTRDRAIPQLKKLLSSDFCIHHGALRLTVDRDFDTQKLKDILSERCCTIQVEQPQGQHQVKYVYIHKLFSRQPSSPLDSNDPQAFMVAFVDVLNLMYLWHESPPFQAPAATEADKACQARPLRP